MNSRIDINKILKEYIGNRKIILFGAGNRGRQVLKIIKKNEIGDVICFIDNKVTKNDIFSVPIYKANQLTKLNKNSFKIIVCTNDFRVYLQISEQLLVLNFSEYENFISSNILKSEFISDENNPYEDIYPAATYAPWLRDSQFIECFKNIENNTLVDIYRCYELWHLVEQVYKLSEGIILEIGVWRGGTGVLMAKKAKLLGIKENVYLCDTFSGVVKACEIDNDYNNGEHSDTSEECVKELINKNNVFNSVVIKGIFPDDTKNYINGQKIRLCHIDVDVYQSAKDIVKFILPNLIIGGIIVFDDFGFKGCNGITRLVEEIKNENNLIVIENLNGHAIFLKIK
ncbi:TylF/MycF/NovP-related O-methyltransferase [Clostridium sp. LBM24168]